MDPSSLCYDGICWLWFWKSARYLESHNWPTHYNILVQCLSLATQPELISHPHQSYTRWLTSVICCGWVYLSIITPLPWYLPAQVLEISLNPRSELTSIWVQYTVFDACNPTRTHFTSKSYKHKVIEIEKLDMLWMGIWIHHHPIATMRGWYRKE
jgi:hypothetical protein